MNNAYQRIWELWGGSVVAAASATLWTPDVTADTTGKLSGDLQTISEILNLWTTTTAGSTGGGSGDILLDRVDLSQIEWLRANATGLGTYTESQVYAVSMIASSNAAASSNKWLLDVWPGVTARYYPAHYRPQFTALAAATDVPDLPDLAQLDVAFLAAWDWAPLVGRTDLVESIARQVSEKSQALLVRRSEAMVDARQDS